jgi:hypothetical protein
MESADVVFLHGSVITVDERFSVKEAIAIKGKRIMKTGSDREIRRLVGPKTRVVDLKGRALMPGFEDSHIHFLSLALLENQIDLSEAKSLNDLITTVREKDAVIPKGSWVLGRGWDQEKIDWDRDYRWPAKKDLDFTEKPVLLFRVCGHIAVVNSKALEIAGIDGDTEVSDGDGVIDRYQNGELTGVLRERAIELVTSKIPIEALKPSMSDLYAMNKKALSKGITCIEEAGADLDDLSIYRSAFSRSMMDLRVNLLLNSEFLDFCIENNIRSPYDIVKERLRICGIKFYADGSLGGRTAALREPYSDDPSTRGVLLMDVQQLTEAFTKAHNPGLQCCTHAIGDRAIKTTIEANEKSYRILNLNTGTFKDRVEHCQIMDEELINSMKKQDMIASIQFSFATSDSPWAAERIGERIESSYAWRALIDSSIRCCGGTDAPVETFVPLEGIEKIVTRGDGQALTIEEAIRLYTIDSAYAQWQESYLGSLEEGKLADLIVLSDNILAVEPARVSELMVDLTMIDGKIVYERE